MPQSKFGGIPVEEQASGSKFGGVPVEETPAAQPQAAAPSVPPNKLEEAISPTGGPDSFWTSPHGLIRTGLRSMVHGARELMTPGARTEGAADLIEGGGRVLAPAAIGATLPALISNPVTTGAGLVGGGLLGKGIQKAAEAGTEYAGGSPAAVRLAGDVAPFAAGPLAKGAGRVLQSAAPSLAEAAMRVGKGDRLTDANPGNALINETSKVRPTSIAKDLNAKAAGLTRETTNIAAKSPNLVDFSSAEAPVAARQARATGAGATTTAEQLQPMRDYWSGQAEPGFAGSVTPTGSKNPIQSALQALQMRREFGPNFRIRYGPQADSTLQEAGRSSYGGATRAIKAAVPEIAPLDERLHDIIPAAGAAESTARNAGLLQRSAGRVAAHTGALAGALLGGHMYGPGGAAAGLILPEMIADPTSMMLAARGTNLAGRILRATPHSTGLIPAITR